MPGDSRSSLSSVGRFAGLGFQLVAAILLFLYGGQWVDRRLGTDPIFLLLGVFIGAAATIYSMYRSLMAEQRREAEQDREKGA
jgi:ATP synthase protein I